MDQQYNGKGDEDYFTNNKSWKKLENKKMESKTVKSDNLVFVKLSFMRDGSGCIHYVTQVLPPFDFLNAKLVILK